MRALSLGLLCLAAGCASFERGALPHLGEWPPAPARAPLTLAVEVAGLPEKFDAGWRAALDRVIREAGHLTPAPAGRAPAATRRLRVTVAHRRQPLPTSRAWMAACALTGGVVPARAVHGFAVEAVVCDASGRALGAVERDVESSTWIGWIFLPVMPFAGVGTTSLVEDTFRSVLGEAAAAGWL